MREEALPEHEQGLLDAFAEVFPRARALIAALRAPRLQRAIRRSSIRGPKTRFVREQPQSGEIGVSLLGEDPLQVRLDPRRARKASVVPHDAQDAAVADDSPDGVLLRVQVLLRETERGAATPTITVTR